MAEDFLLAESSALWQTVRGEGEPQPEPGVGSVPIREGEEGHRVHRVLSPGWPGPAVCRREGLVDLGRPSLRFTPLVPGPIQVEELGCLEVESEARMENLHVAIPGQPPALVSGAHCWEAWPSSWAQSS